MFVTLQKHRTIDGRDTGGESMVNHVYLNGVRIAAVAPSGSASYYLSDQVDSVTVVLDDGGKIVTQHEYLPFGETWITEGDKKNAPKYNSQELDRETNFYYYNARHYDPEISRFISPDTVIDGEDTAAGWNRYMYVHGNPIIYKDPSGHDVVVLNSETGANNRGHSAMLIEMTWLDKKDPNYGKWKYVSKNGITQDGKLPSDFTANYVSKENKREINHERVFDSPDAFFKHQKEAVDIYNSSIKSGKSEKDLPKEVLEYVSKKGGQSRYEEGFRIQTDPGKMDKEIHDRALKFNRTPYNLFGGGNCNELVDDSLDKSRWTSDILVPKDWYKSMKEHYTNEYKAKIENNVFKK
jgi:RHS repeat-associated protein